MQAVDHKGYFLGPLVINGDKQLAVILATLAATIIRQTQTFPSMNDPSQLLTYKLGIAFKIT